MFLKKGGFKLLYKEVSSKMKKIITDNDQIKEVTMFLQNMNLAL